ncbi:Protein sidekick-1 [Gryllus bimaculatus]|nr:Protein sidekick-1 [Gryllus bimaculatus]
MRRKPWHRKRRVGTAGRWLGHGSGAVSKAKILGNPELYIKSGSDINLTCVVLETPEPPSFIYWYQGAQVINYSQRGGINVVTEKQTRTSRLLISRALPQDSGNYTCSPSSSDSASVMVHVLNGERRLRACVCFQYDATSMREFGS